MVTNETQEQLEARGWDFTEEFIPDEPTVNNQDKTVDVSENGTIEVMPDEGFTGLGKVTVNTNVESSGDWEYYDVSNAVNDQYVYGAYLSAVFKKAEVQDGVISKTKIGCYLFAYASSDYDKHLALAVDYSQLCIDANGERTLREQIALYPNSEIAGAVAMLQSFPRLTKEQFYDLNA